VEFQQSANLHGRANAGFGDRMPISPIRPIRDHVRIACLEAFALIIISVALGLIMALGMAVCLRLLKLILLNSL
jgi:hypothetical protein